MSDLTEFLLARVAEDEAGEVVYTDIIDGRWKVLRTRVDHVEPSRRWLAECEAKRRIMEWMSNWQADVALEGMLLLAAVYAEHPDFREEWRA